MASLCLFCRLLTATALERFFVVVLRSEFEEEEAEASISIARARVKGNLEDSLFRKKIDLLLS